MLRALSYLSCEINTAHGIDNKKVAVVKSVLLVRSIAFLRGEVASCSMYEERKCIPDTGFQPGVLRLCFDTVRSPVRSTTESQLSGELATARLAILEQSCNLAYRLSLS